MSQIMELVWLAPDIQRAILEYPAGAATSFTAAASTTSGGSWLKVSPASGTTPSSLNVSVDTTGLSVGTYYGNIAITPGAGSEIDVGVTLTVHGGPHDGHGHGGR